MVLYDKIFHRHEQKGHQDQGGETWGHIGFEFGYWPAMGCSQAGIQGNNGDLIHHAEEGLLFSVSRQGIRLVWEKGNKIVLA